MTIFDRFRGSVYLRYLGNLLLHKWFVFLECCKAGIPIRGLLHDLSKFLPSEFGPYARHFGRSEVQRAETTAEEEARIQAEFKLAWNAHQNRNKHHWENWVLIGEDEDELLEMNTWAFVELVCDWRGYGRQHGKSAEEYYALVRNDLKLAPLTRELLDDLLNSPLI